MTVVVVGLLLLAVVVDVAGVLMLLRVGDWLAAPRRGGSPSLDLFGRLRRGFPWPRSESRRTFPVAGPATGAGSRPAPTTCCDVATTAAAGYDVRDDAPRSMDWPFDAGDGVGDYRACACHEDRETFFDDAHARPLGKLRTWLRGDQW